MTKKQKIMWDQAKFFSRLAGLLHIRVDQVGSLVTRNSHPLPLPQPSTQRQMFELDEAYLRTLYSWIRQEGRLQARERGKAINFDTVTNTFSSFRPVRWSQQKWSIDDVIGAYPSGHFLG